MADQELSSKVADLKEDYDALRQLEQDSACKLNAQATQIAKLEEQHQYHLDRIVLLDKQMSLFIELANSYFGIYAIDGKRFPGKINAVESAHWEEVERRNRQTNT